MRIAEGSDVERATKGAARESVAAEEAAILSRIIVSTNRRMPHTSCA